MAHIAGQTVQRPPDSSGLLLLFVTHTVVTQSINIIEGEPEWEVEQIMGARRFGRTKQLQYRVRWVGYSDAHDTWETADDVHAPQLTVEFWKGNQALAKEIAYKPPQNDEEGTIPLSISLMTTHGTDRHHSHQCQSTSDEEHPHASVPNNGGSHSKPGSNQG